MTHAAFVFACVLQIVEPQGGGVDEDCMENQEVAEVAPIILAEAAEHDVKPAIIAAAIYHESRFKKYARGTKGEVGLMQIKRHGAVQGRYLRMSFRQLADYKVNIHIGVEYMAPFAHQCATASRWLTAYNHGPGCHTSRYSAGVLKHLALGRGWARSLIAAGAARLPAE